MSNKGIKVLDRRMFDADGQLREAYRDTVDDSRDAAPAPAAPASDTSSTVDAEPQSSSEPIAGGPIASGPIAASPEPDAAPVEAKPKESGATFRDLVGLLAQSTSVYLSQTQQAPIEQRSEVLEVARMHLDLLEILKESTTGNLSASDSALMDDALYRLRMAFVEYG